MNYPTISPTVGNTPLVYLRCLPEDNGSILPIKPEGNNPADSMNDRPGLRMIRQEKKHGQIRPGDAFIAVATDNTGSTLTVAAAIKSCRLQLVIPDRPGDGCLPAGDRGNQPSPGRRKSLSCDISFDTAAAAILSPSRKAGHAMQVAVVCSRSDRYLSAGIFDPEPH